MVESLSTARTPAGPPRGLVLLVALAAVAVIVASVVVVMTWPAHGSPSPRGVDCCYGTWFTP